MLVLARALFEGPERGSLLEGKNMTIGAYCTKCGRIVFATSHKIGSPIVCPGCGEVLQVATGISRDEPVNLACPRCASVLRVIREPEGHRIRCTTCQLVLCVSTSPWKLTPFEELIKPKADAAGHEAWQSRMAAAAAQQAASRSPTSDPSATAPPTSTIVASHATLSLPISPAPADYASGATPAASPIVSPQSICPWVTPPELLDLAEMYQQQGNCQTFACRCGEVLNTVYGAEMLVRAGHPAKRRIYPDMVGVEEQQTPQPSLADQGSGVANQVAAAIGTVLGLTVGWGRFRFGTLRREAIRGCYGG